MNKATNHTEAVRIQAAARNFWWGVMMDPEATPRENAEARRVLRAADKQLKMWEGA